MKISEQTTALDNADGFGNPVTDDPGFSIHMSNLSLCNGGSYLLHVQQGYKYLWNTWDTTNVITVTQSGKYNVAISDEKGLVAQSSVFVDLTLLREIVIADSQPRLFKDGIIVLDAIPGFKYEWNTGEYTPFILVTKPGVYVVTITDENECSIVSNALEIMPDNGWNDNNTRGDAQKDLNKTPGLAVDAGIANSIAEEKTLR